MLWHISWQGVVFVQGGSLVNFSNKLLNYMDSCAFLVDAFATVFRLVCSRGDFHLISFLLIVTDAAAAVDDSRKLTHFMIDWFLFSVVINYALHFARFASQAFVELLFQSPTYLRPPPCYDIICMNVCYNYFNEIPMWYLICPRTHHNTVEIRYIQ